MSPTYNFPTTYLEFVWDSSCGFERVKDRLRERSMLEMGIVVLGGVVVLVFSKAKSEGATKRSIC